ncbi:MmgE/PrpD family protein [Acuticoccus sp. MNP-M23]|uniref:MmgE/PrpD family protein n=1 Tax=Acuticoccus sp. MNP-M23 TaxID=3072793 RepID=UPI0028162710|nr:MmgE/PrpD family protein [Acuticoccus sp. MNP-M23]WMS43787.1 MmgE/PrpD family protein [Acuticoccus sp. MNP-M23]
MSTTRPSAAIIDRMIDLAARPPASLPADALAMARASLTDWLVCGRAAVDEPVAQKLRAFAAQEGDGGPASLFGGKMAPARTAALVNGATSHALDYDDTHFDHVGHLSVGIYPAALAAGEAADASAGAVVDAFLVGAEAAIRLGCVLGAQHYNRGFHQTATAGAFGATMAAARLGGLSRSKVRAALGLCATRASGLKSQFGTMGKPLNAGIAASNGVEAAALAALGVTSADDGVLGAQGFVPTHADAPDEAAFGEDDGFRFLTNSYKFHACCHGTHAMIEALAEARDAHGLTLSDVASLRVATNPRWLRVCDIKAPRTGLEVKFSYVWLAGMVLAGMRTGDDRIYADALAGDALLAAFADRVEVVADEGVSDQQAAVTLHLTSGKAVEASHDLAAPILPEVLAARIAAKARAVLPREAEALLALTGRLGGVSARDLGAFVRSGQL